MIYDYCEIEIYIPVKVKPNWNVLEETGTVVRGAIHYQLRGVKGLTVIWDDKTRFLRIKGSLAYYFQGHNFSCPKNDFQAGWRFISNLLDVNLFDAWVIAFEVGELLKVPFNPQACFLSHTTIKGMKSQLWPTGRTFVNKVLRVKIYDAGKRFKQIVPIDIRNALHSNFGYLPDANYIRIENHYKKPEIHFKQSPIMLADIVTNSFENRCKSDLLQTYESIIKTPTVLMQISKHKPSTSNLLLITLKQLELEHGFDSKEEINKILLGISTTSLTKEDLKKRKQQIKKYFSKIVNNSCQYDLINSLRNELFK